MNKIIKIELEVFVTPIEKAPTCALNFAEGKTCDFLMSTQFGGKNMCFFDFDKNLQRSEEGFLIPSEKCKVHIHQDHIREEEND